MKFAWDDTFFLLVRSTLGLFLFYKLGFLYGLLACTALNYLNSFIMWHVFGLEALYPVDELFINDDKTNPSNIVSKPLNKILILFPLIGAIITKKYDFEKLRDQFYN